MKKNKKLTELKNEIDNKHHIRANEEKIKEVFEKLLKELEIGKEVSLLDNLYLQPFKTEYTEKKQGIKDYFSIDKEREEKADKYCKIVKKENGKLISLKSFGRVSELKRETFDKLILLIRLSQYIHKNRELYSLEISILNIIK